MDNLTHTGREESIQKLSSLIKGIRVAMLTSYDKQAGVLHSRPMLTQESEFNGTLWFFTGLQSHKVDELEQDSHVSLAYANPEKNLYVSVSGTARVVTDKSKASELWNDSLKTWFPQGVNDPNLALISVEVESAEYWDSPSSTLVRLAGFARSVLGTTQPAPEKMSDHGRIDLQ